MSASGSGGLTPIEVINQARGRPLSTIAVSGIGGALLAWALGLVQTIQTLFSFILLPFELLIDVAAESVSAFILEPIGLVGVGADITAGELDVFGLFALPVSVVMALGVLFIVILYLQFQTTSNIIPGLFIDNRLIDFLFTSPEEEAEGED